MKRAVNQSRRTNVTMRIKNVCKRLQTNKSCYFRAMDRKCLECGEVLNGRKDKRFCDDQCRSTFYNKQNSDSTNLVRKVNNVLRKNRRILAELNPNGKAVVHQNDLLTKGFNFSYYTNSFKTKTGNIYHFCYEYGYLALEDNRYSLVIKEDWVN